MKFTAPLSSFSNNAGYLHRMTEAVGEDAWLALVDEASRTARDLEQRVGVVELYKQAIAAEPWSNKLWLAYCEWVWSLHTDCQNGDAGWPEEEQELGKEVFAAEIALDVWQQGARATQYRLSDSHELWNRWMSIELDRLSKDPGTENIERIRSLFLERLQIPHATWDDTSTIFSSFITKYDEPSYESTMVQSTKLAQPAKDLYSNREIREMQLKRAVESGDLEALKTTMRSYLNWENEQATRKSRDGTPASPPILCVALYERAFSSTPLGGDAATWESYIVFLSTVSVNATQTQLPDVLSVIQRATTHCPWSGALWARYILRAESERLPFETMERIKHTATDNRALDRDGMGEVVEFYVAWVGFLKRRTTVQGADEDVFDIATMGLRTAVESVQEWGQKRHGKEWKGDPSFRIERIFIQYLTQQQSFEEARGYWRRLVHTHGDSYEFWQQYYLWEMTVRLPTSPLTVPTSVLTQALNRRNLDWPEKMMEIFIRHCNNYEEVDVLLNAMVTVHRLSKKVSQRREREAVEQAAAWAQQQPQAETGTAVESEAGSGQTKRKREVTAEETTGSAKKKVKSEAEQKAVREQELKRDRENTSIIVRNLPADVTQSKVRLYFKDYGHFNAVTLKPELDKSSTTGIIEFREPAEAQSALLRDGKYFGDRQIQVKPGTGLTIFVTNFPPTADEQYLHNLFKDCGEIFSLRWPSLKKDAHRRFCYISFKTPEGAAAATQLDGKSLGGVYTLNAKYSDPGSKKERVGAIAEGREVHLTGVDRDLTEKDLRDVFSKYGKVEKVRILQTLQGMSKGAAFISFQTKEQAEASLELDKTKLKSSILVVEMSTDKKYKPTAMTGKASSASPAPDADGDSMMPGSPGRNRPMRDEAYKRTITLLNIPDTVNDARIRKIAEPFGEIMKLVLRLDHQGAIIEYADATMATTASLGLHNWEIIPGRRIKTGGMRELFAQKEEMKTEKLPAGRGKPPPSFITQSAPIRRPGPGPRGGLGAKRGLGFPAPKPAASAGPTQSTTNGASEETKKPKTNADFKAMFVKGEPQ